MVLMKFIIIILILMSCGNKRKDGNHGIQPEPENEESCEEAPASIRSSLLSPNQMVERPKSVIPSVFIKTKEQYFSDFLISDQDLVPEWVSLEKNENGMLRFKFKDPVEGYQNIEIFWLPFTLDGKAFFSFDWVKRKNLPYEFDLENAPVVLVKFLGKRDPYLVYDSRYLPKYAYFDLR